MTRGRTLIKLSSFFLFLATISDIHGEILGDYVGYSACTSCHGEMVAGWKSTGHARAFQTLKTQGDEKQQNPGCVQCHAVAYDKEGGFIDMELTPELSGVQCESCHGPGRRHAETMNSSDIMGKPEEKTCRTCHTEAQDKAFNFEKKIQMIHGKT
jgi:formate-dependent nitrite reductase cytochrome c552 subunit